MRLHLLLAVNVARRRPHLTFGQELDVAEAVALEVVTPSILEPNSDPLLLATRTPATADERGTIWVGVINLGLSGFPNDI